MITERLFQFIWQFQYFNNSELTTVTGEPLQIIHPGLSNLNQGPDFSNARIRIGDNTWAGTVELHILTSDWNRHQHQNDSNYRSVILHVVWEDDRTDLLIPVLELKSRVPKLLLQRYRELMDAGSFIPCEKTIRNIPDLNWKGWIDRMLAERLLRKAALVQSYLQENKNHWEETFWWLLARSYGMKVNADAFEAIARSIPLKLLRKFSELYQYEALLFGQAGLLNKEFKDEYPGLISREYSFNYGKYEIKPNQMPLLFLRMRPGNFPTIRLAQLSALVHGSVRLFAKIKEANSLKEVKKWFNTPAGKYWDNHYLFDEPSAFRPKMPGNAFVDSIIINTIAPVLFAYGDYHSDQSCKDKALQWLEETAAENNSIIKGFGQAGIEIKTAYDSQALIELKTQYCDRKRCLDCGVGNYLLKTAK